MSDTSDKFERLKRAGEYPAFTRAILDSIPDKELEHEIFSYILKKKIRGDRERAFEIVSELPPGFRMVYATWLVSMEVPNGGFNQFFWNNDPRFAVLARDGFTLIGAGKLANLMGRVIQVRGLEEKDVEPFYQEGSAKAFSESYKHSALDELDSAFYELKYDGQCLRTRYIRSHPEAFVG